MNVLIDYHHSDLGESLHRLFEDRLGFKVYIPAGLEWRTEGYWMFGRMYPDAGMGVARQFLEDNRAADDLQPDRPLRRITLEQARTKDWALVMASVPDNEHGFARFASEQGARYGVEVGNVNQHVDRSLSQFILDSTGQYRGGTAFTPEFDLSAFRYSPPTPNRRVASFVNLFPGLPCYGPYLQTMEYLPNWTGGVYGHNGPDGFVKPTTEIARYMRNCAFGWHDKVSGDGFGYVIHYWAAVGRPLIGHASHYAGQLAADLWEDGVTCIDLDRHSPEETARLMDEIVSDPILHGKMSATIAERVRKRLDFDGDAQRVSEALGLLVAA